MRSKEEKLLPHYNGKLKYYSPASQPWLTQILQRADAPTEGRMLDVGCGDGRACRWARDHGMMYHGIDYSIARIHHARVLHNDMPFGHGDIYEELLQVGTADLVVCFEVLEHLEEPKTVWALMQRCVAPGGLLVCTCPVNMPYKAHLQVYKTDEDIVQIFQPHLLVRYRTRVREHFVFTWGGPCPDE